jgi:hypothetical protein
MNRGSFNFIDGIYTKHVAFNKAVLWKDRQLSLPLPIISICEKRNITKLVFIDAGKNEKWEFNLKKVQETGERKMVGQEPQWYFPIELANKKVFKENFTYR